MITLSWFALGWFTGIGMLCLAGIIWLLLDTRRKP